MLKILLATRNAGKLREVREILSAAGVTVEALDSHPGFEGEDVEETGSTFLENALIKAQWAAARSGQAVVADDSGLEVDALGGHPGVRSARYAGDAGGDLANNERLIAELSQRPQEPRTARFRCVAVLAVPREAADGPLAALAASAVPAALEQVGEGTPVQLDGGFAMAFSGVIEGEIIDEPRGSGGFGYDPHFLLPALGKTTAELPAEEKNARSHRGQAFRKLARALGATPT